MWAVGCVCMWAVGGIDILAFSQNYLKLTLYTILGECTGYRSWYVIFKVINIIITMALK